MQLTDTQKQHVAQWVNEGASLQEVQRRLDEEFDVSLTYMDVRFLVDDLELELKDAPGSQDPEEKAPEHASGEGVHFHEDEAPDSMPAESMTGAEDVADAEAEFVGGGGGGNVSVEVDKITRPGAVISGSVTFGDGVKAGWQLDQMGRLGIIPPASNKEYKPSEQDIQDFQVELQNELRKQGF